jgi:sulfide dehydrogenase [flavocytochrome c] flavoprotein subunit
MSATGRPDARRQFLQRFGGGLAAVGLSRFAAAGTTAATAKRDRRVVVIGAGFGGTIAAKTIRMLDPGIQVVLVEQQKRHVSCPLSNLVLAGLRQIDELTFGYERLAANHGIKMVFGEATVIDAEKKRVAVNDEFISYDRLILSPGIDFRFDEIDGYDRATTPQVMPHAWQAGNQTLLLRQQLREMKNGGTVIISIPLTPYRCPPAPYERACLIAWTLKKAKPRSKLIILDANPDLTAMATPFVKAWQTHYPGLVEYQGAKRVTAIDAGQNTLLVEGLEEVHGDVVNLIPPQRAGAIAARAGLLGADRHWCPIDPTTFESTLVPGIHIIGDACNADAMPRSGTAANAAAKVCAANIVAQLSGREPVTLSAVTTCYSFLTDTDALSIAGGFKVEDGRIVAKHDAEGISPVEMSATRDKAVQANSWLHDILAEMSN